MTINSIDYWSDVPSAEDDDTPSSPGPRRAAWPKVSRRTMFKSVGVLGGALALNVVGALPPARLKGASATVGNEYGNCGDPGYNNWTGYKDGTTQTACVGAPYSSGYCGSDGWFRTDGNSYSYYTPVKACGEGSATKKNAWRWTYSGTPYRCADGTFTVYGAGTTFYICSRANP
ncbi:hypothetical protein GCM10009677_63430 [Sphaerisporangium rubeum]|uniref:Uncharacterized protein n=1 Tax=Sphaerisporangium rubeum TaxID=321317 RepID=A0A7X0M4X8_9ACTN|nr:hypothetical protein [Sphaerisporangium rubeum]MBB6471632.1 hypothetical protein [Sphaerisporangium rubeum]